MSAGMLSNMSSSILNSSSGRPTFETLSGGFLDSRLEEVLVEEVADAGTLFGDLLDTVVSDNTENMSESDSDDEILNFLSSKFQSKKLVSKGAVSSFRASSKDTNPMKKDDLSQNNYCSNYESQAVQTFLNETAMDGPASRGKCMNKSAVNARLQRIKKKRYIGKLEGKIKSLESENTNLSTQLCVKSNQIEQMNNEINYLKSVIANQTSLSALLHHIPFTKEMQFGSPLTSYVTNKNKVVHTPSMKKELPKKRGREEHSDSHCDSDISVSSEGDVLIVRKALKKQAVDKSGFSPSSNAASSPKEERVPSPRDDSVTSSSEEAASGVPPSTPGVCLHVSSNKVTLEFCASCASSAASVFSAITDETESDRENANVLQAG